MLNQWVDLAPSWPEIERVCAERHEQKREYASHNPIVPDCEIVGLAGEYVYAEVMGGDPDIEHKPEGDGGRDFDFNGGIVNVKSSKYPNPKLLQPVDAKHWPDYFALSHVDLEQRRGRLLGIVPARCVRSAPVRDVGGQGFHTYTLSPGDVARYTTALLRLVA